MNAVRLERHGVLFYVVLALTIAVSVAVAATGHLREAPFILLFLPLIWAFMALPPVGMVLVGLLMAAVRVLVEAEEAYVATGAWNLPSALKESIFPIGLYAALGLAFYFYRRRQAVLAEQLLRARAMEAFADLSRRVAHDLNNVFTVIAGAAELLAKEKALSAETAEDVKSIREASRQGMDMLGELRRMTRMHDGSPAPASLSEAVARQMALIRRVLPENIRVRCEYADQPLIVRLNSGQFDRVLTNLCVNARDAMPAGGELTVRTERQTVGNKDFAVLSVSDTGVGMDARTLRHAFEPFYTTRSDKGGTGLGLSICRALVQAHNGHIDARSTPGRGTTFMVLLPLEDEAPAAQPAAAPPPQG